MFAQSEATVQYDDPNYAEFMAQIGLGLETDFTYRTEVPLSIDFHYDLENLPIELDLSFMASVFSERKRSFYPDNLSDNEYQPFNSFEMGGVYNFFDKTEEKSIRVLLRRFRRTKFNGTQTTEYYTMSNGLVRKRFGVRTGIYRYAQSITDYDSVDRSIEFADGTSFPDAENAWSGGLTEDEKFYFTAERHLAAYFGLCYHRSYAIQIDAGQFGEKRAMANVFIYADMFLDVASDIQKISYNGELYDLTEATSGVDLKNIGFRLGAKKVDPVIFYSFEAGLKPQYFEPQFYLQFLIGYSFNKNL